MGVVQRIMYGSGSKDNDECGLLFFSIRFRDVLNNDLLHPVIMER